MSVLKKYIFKAILILIILLSLVLCIYRIQNYKGNTSNIPNRTEQHYFSDSARTPSDQFLQPSPIEPGAPPNFQVQRGKALYGVSYGPLLLIYSIIFLGLSIAAYYLLAQGKIHIKPDNREILIIALLCVGLLLRVYFSLLIEEHPDVNIFKNLAATASSEFSNFYSNPSSSDYPPLYIYVLFLIGKAVSIPFLNGYFTLLIKLPSIIADIASAHLIFRLTNKRFSWGTSMVLSTFYIFNPAVFINSTFWGQVDSFFTLIILIAVSMLSEKKVVFSSILFAGAVLMKPQGIIFLPVLFFELVRQKDYKNFISAALVALCTAMIVVIPFSHNKDMLWILRLYSSTIGKYPYASVNAYNFFSMIGANYTKDTSTFFIFSYHTWGMIFIIMITLSAWFIYIKGKNNALAPTAALILIAGVFTFSVGMHERYLYPAVALSLMSYIYIGDKRFLHLSLGFSTTVYLNTHLILFNTLGMTSLMPFSLIIASMSLIVIISLTNVLIFIYLTRFAFDIVVNKNIQFLSHEVHIIS